MDEKKFDEGQDFYKKSISFDNSESMYKYGRFLIKSKGLIFNTVKEYNLIKKSIDKGYLKAMFKYGIILLEGDGIDVIKNEEKGMQYIKIAAENGYKDALYYCYSIESKKDNVNEEKLYQLLKKAAFKGHVESSYQYGKKII